MKSKLIKKVEKEIVKLEKRYVVNLEIDPKLTRRLVSFQANKGEEGYRWFKFKEGFSSALVKYYLNKLKIGQGEILDPFAGSGTALFTASADGLDAMGIELLPIGLEIMWIRRYTLGRGKKPSQDILEEWTNKQPWHVEKKSKTFPHIPITSGAFLQENEEKLGKYLMAVDKVEKQELRRLLKFVALCILEDISYTRKDGQYLRWDFRSGRRPTSKPFNKGRIKSFDEAVLAKMQEIKGDIESIDKKKQKAGIVRLSCVSCLGELPKLERERFNFLMTSPPYCNRYDYTRTYALELAFLGVGSEKIKDLRQTMLSCTVENKAKLNLEKKFSAEVFREAEKSFYSQKTLAAILDYLEHLKEQKELNNTGIVRMVKNYFYEMALVIFEAARVLKKGAPFVMVNDNVRYAGVGVPVDLILSDFAQAAGFNVEKIWILPNGKGNSSQQMGKYGRTENRKCVYVWRKK